MPVRTTWLRDPELCVFFIRRGRGIEPHALSGKLCKAFFLLLVSELGDADVNGQHSHVVPASWRIPSASRYAVVTQLKNKVKYNYLTFGVRRYTVFQ